ncbi:hypothetical protein [Chryseobacterium foetidum]|uniref:hypothetical protein n=1 Tax=Chryseobacterium foetidum TaxID=2951057 RepID=UPI0021C644EB|nr:hypothetical protein [Chryseobacterium foetidum]
MDLNDLPESPPQFSIIRRFVDLFLFGRSVFITDTRYLTSDLADYLEANPFDGMKRDVNQDQLMIHFEKTITLFLEISSKKERMELVEWYNCHPCKKIINQLVTIQRQNYSFQYRYFPLDLDDDLIEHSLIHMKIMPIQIFSMLANQLARISWYIRPVDGQLDKENYDKVFTWLLYYYEPSEGLMLSTDTLLDYIHGKPRDLEQLSSEDEIESYNYRIKKIISENLYQSQL